ncbi:hypothetical protein LP420_17270 [Massilia sp. B-10]|nr:hypothetical protein LP420_17270 [Massilia sp. B-10]
MVLILLTGIFGELPMHATIVGAMVKDPAMQQRIQLILLGLALYSLFWVVGDRRAMLGSSIVVSDAALDIQVGNRFSAVIARQAIVRCEAPRYRRTLSGANAMPCLPMPPWSQRLPTCQT